MKTNFFILTILFINHLGFSQTEKLIKGKVTCDNFPIQGIEIINLISEKSTLTNSSGEFSILAKTEEMLVFVSKNYEYKRLFLEKEDINKTNLTIILIRRPEQLEEVVITKISFPKIKFDRNIASQLNIEKEASNVKNPFTNTGTITNGIGMFINLPLNKKPKSQIEFKKLAITTCTQEYFKNSLQLKAEEVALFLDFCDADSKSKISIENSNPLIIMDFLFAKNIEFKKLSTLEK
jgi:hypothetical protein